MPVYLFIEYDNAKDESRRNQYRKWIVEEWQPYFKELQEEDFFKTTGFTDGTGHMMGLWEFEDTDAFSKLWNDEKWHRLMIRRNEVVDNLKIRLCRPSIVIEP